MIATSALVFYNDPMLQPDPIDDESCTENFESTEDFIQWAIKMTKEIVDEVPHYQQVIDKLTSGDYEVEDWQGSAVVVIRNVLTAKEYRA